MFPTNAPRFACDAMLGALARWLRAAGYEAAWVPHIDDWDLIRLARREQRILLSSDTRLFKIGIVRDGDLPALFVPNGLGKKEQLAFVHCRLHLTALPPRCMARRHVGCKRRQSVRRLYGISKPSLLLKILRRGVRSLRLCWIGCGRQPHIWLLMSPGNDIAR